MNMFDMKCPYCGGGEIESGDYDEYDYDNIRVLTLEVYCFDCGRYFIFEEAFTEGDREITITSEDTYPVELPPEDVVMDWNRKSLRGRIRSLFGRS